MGISWTETELDVSPRYRAIADTDKETLSFDAEQAITGESSAVLTRLDTNAQQNDLITVVPATPYVNVTVEGLTRGVTYELTVTFANSAGRRWTRRLILDCVA